MKRRERPLIDAATGHAALVPFDLAAKLRRQHQTRDLPKVDPSSVLVALLKRAAP